MLSVYCNHVAYTVLCERSVVTVLFLKDLVVNLYPAILSFHMTQLKLKAFHTLKTFIESEQFESTKCHLNQQSVT